MKSETTTWIKTRRQLMGITQKQMAEKAGISQQLYQYFESGKRRLTTCSFNTACKVLEALGHDIAEFYHHGFSSDYRLWESLQQQFAAVVVTAGLLAFLTCKLILTSYCLLYKRIHMCYT